MPHHANQTSFRAGPDPRRHVFSQAERRKGFWVATRLSKQPSRVLAWLRNKIKRHYQGKPDRRAAQVALQMEARRKLYGEEIP